MNITCSGRCSENAGLAVQAHAAHARLGGRTQNIPDYMSTKEEPIIYTTYITYTISV